MNQLVNQHHQTFEGIRQQTGEGRAFWSEGDLQPILEYSSWDKFKAVIRKSIIACDNSGISSADHFSHMGKMVAIGSGAECFVEDLYTSKDSVKWLGKKRQQSLTQKCKEARGDA